MEPSTRVSHAKNTLDQLISEQRSMKIVPLTQALRAAHNAVLSLSGVPDADLLATLSRNFDIESRRALNQIVSMAAAAVRVTAGARPFDPEGSYARYAGACEDAARAATNLGIAAQRVLAAPESYAAAPVQLVLQASSLQAVDFLARQAGDFGEVRRLSYVPYIGVRCPGPLADELIFSRAALGKSGLVSARPARVYSVKPLHATQIRDNDDWNLQLLGAERAWEYARGAGSHVAIIDTGVDYNHRELSSCFADGHGIDLVDSGSPMDQNGHGTHVAGTVAGASTGVAPSATLYAVRVLDENGFGDEVTVLQGIEWAVQHKVDVINMSLGSSYPSDGEAELVKLAAAQGIAVVCAAGNDGNTSYNYPASYPGAISVAAVDCDKKHASFSNRNNLVDLCAPGVSIYSLAPGGGYTYLSGTSMATPHIAGACALLKSAAKLQYESILQTTAEKLGEKNKFGAGLIRLPEALSYE